MLSHERHASPPPEAYALINPDEVFCLLLNDSDFMTFRDRVRTEDLKITPDCDIDSLGLPDSVLYFAQGELADPQGLLDHFLFRHFPVEVGAQDARDLKVEVGRRAWRTIAMTDAQIVQALRQPLEVEPQNPATIIERRFSTQRDPYTLRRLAQQAFGLQAA